MKKAIKIYLEPKDIIILKQKAGAGRGTISRYIEKIAREPIVFLDNNTQTILKALKLKPSE